MNKKIVYIDLDGVLANFQKGVGRKVDRFERPNEMLQRGFYANLEVLDGSYKAICELLLSDKLDIYIASKPTIYNPYCMSEKYEWVYKHFPELIKKVNLVCDKGLLKGDFLIDDSTRWHGKFEGQCLKFDPDNSKFSWDCIIKFFNSRNLL